MADEACDGDLAPPAPERRDDHTAGPEPASGPGAALEPGAELEPGAGTVSWRALHHETIDRLRRAGIEAAESDARRLIEEASGYEGSAFHAGLDQPARVRAVVRLDTMVERRLGGEPLQYVLGRWAFRTLDLAVDRRVLIPRPETEVVAGVAIDHLRALAAGGGEVVAVDLGTGSGAIGLSIAVEVPTAAVWLTDASPDALAVARANLTGIGREATRVRIVEGSWFAALPDELRGSCDVVISNPPYVATTDALPAVVADWEPASALYAGERGTDDLDHLVDAAPAWLRAGGLLVLELSPDQAPAIADRARARGFVDVSIVADLAGRPRALRAVWPPPPANHAVAPA